MSNRLIIGVVSKPQGIKGEIKISPLTDNPERFEQLKNVYINNKCYEVKNSKVQPNGVFLSLVGIDDRNQAELLRNQEISIDRIQAVKLEEDRHFIVDVIGCKVVINDKTIGKIKDILQYGSADIYVIATTDNKTAMIPAIERLILDINTKNRVVLVDGQAYDDLVVYED